MWRRYVFLFGHFLFSQDQLFFGRLPCVFKTFDEVVVFAIFFENVFGNRKADFDAFQKKSLIAGQNEQTEQRSKDEFPVAISREKLP